MKFYLKNLNVLLYGITIIGFLVVIDKFYKNDENEIPVETDYRMTTQRSLVLAEDIEVQEEVEEHFSMTLKESNSVKDHLDKNKSSINRFDVAFKS